LQKDEVNNNSIYLSKMNNKENNSNKKQQIKETEKPKIQETEKSNYLA
jgi:hypothetical protein